MSENDNNQDSPKYVMTENHHDSNDVMTENHYESEYVETQNHHETVKPTEYDIGKPMKAGTVILGRYEVLSELGRGGMGVVYRCFDKISGTEVAVKMLPPEVSHSDYDMEDVKDNYALVSKLIHQNIAAYKTLEADNDGDYYVVMEYVQGEELRRWMRRKRREGTLTLETALPVLRQMAEALDFAHREKVIHRDIKPGNVMVKSDGTVKILDFGLAAQIRTSYSHVSNAEMGQSGTRQYKSPEQWRCQPQGEAADQYALAAMAYEMLGGRVPFDDDDPIVLRESVLKEPPPHLEDYSDAVNAVLTRGLAKDAKQRFESCREFVSFLQQADEKGCIKISGPIAEIKEPAERSLSDIQPIVRNHHIKRYLILTLLVIVLAYIVGKIWYDYNKKQMEEQKVVEDVKRDVQNIGEKVAEAKMEKAKYNAVEVVKEDVQNIGEKVAEAKMEKAKYKAMEVVKEDVKNVAEKVVEAKKEAEAKAEALAPAK